MADRRTLFGAGFGAVGVGVGVTLSVLGLAEVNLPGWLLITIASMAGLLFFVGVGLMITAAVVPDKKSVRRQPMPEEENQPLIHIESHNQQGGITAYQVNIQPGDRQLTENAAAQLKSCLDGVNFRSVEVTAVMGDGEAFRFASQIKNFLASLGVDVNGVDQAVYSAPVQGQILKPPNEDGIVKVIIGNR